MMTYPFENRMAVEGQREYEERYSTPDWEYFKDDFDDIVTYCDVYECSECPRLYDTCDGKYLDEEEEEDDA